MADVKTALQFVQLQEKKKDLERRLKEVKADIATLEGGLIEWMQTNTLQNLGAGGSTVYLNRQIFASIPDKEAGNQALKEAGLGDLVEERVLPQRLSAWVREQLAEAEKDGSFGSDNLADDLPVDDKLKSLLRVTEKFSVRVRKA